MLAQIVNSISIKNHDFVFIDAPDEMGEKLLHVAISAKSRSNNPGVDSFFPRAYFMNPLLVDLPDLLRTDFLLLLGNENGVHDDLGGVRLDRDWGRFRAEDVSEIASGFETGNGCIVRSACELIASSDHCHPPVITLVHGIA